MSTSAVPRRDDADADRSGPAAARWTTVNAKEALPGVIRPLTFTYYWPATERAIARFWQDLGVLERKAPEESDDPSLRFSGLFRGRIAFNVDRWGEMANRMPGMSQAAYEEQMFGVARSGADTRGSRRRYPLVALRAPGTVLRARRATMRQVGELAGWRKKWLTELADGDSKLARQAFREAQGRMEWGMYRHIMLSAVAQGCFEAVGKLARSLGREGAELELAATHGTEESDLVETLHEVANGKSSVESFVDSYGFHGTDSAHLNAVVWRQDPAQVEGLLARYREAEGRRGAQAADERRQRRLAMVADLLGSLPAWRRPGARLQLRMAWGTAALRELGRSQLLQVTDVAREAAVVVGHALARTGALDDHGDVFFLTAQELLGDEPISRGAVAHRRAEYEHFMTVDLPASWSGEPEEVPIRTRDGNPTPAGMEITGFGVSAGTFTGRARIVHDPGSDEFDVDEVLVCSITDPGWASIMAIAGAIVIDTGGPVSHGAIVARELGVPAVVNTGDGTLRLRDGDEVAVDGRAGTVTVITPA